MGMDRDTTRWTLEPGWIDLMKDECKLIVLSMQRILAFELTIILVKVNSPLVP